MEACCHSLNYTGIYGFCAFNAKVTEFMKNKLLSFKFFEFQAINSQIKTLSEKNYLNTS